MTRRTAVRSAPPLRPPHRRMTRLGSANGHSLLELLTVVVLLGILTSLAAPSVRGAVQRARVRAALDAVSSDIYRARALAARSGRELRLRFPAEASGCVRRYSLEDPRLNRTLLRVDLQGVARGVCLSVHGPPEIRINARGLPVGAARKVRARLGSVGDSVSISWVGRVYRWGYAMGWARAADR